MRCALNPWKLKTLSDQTEFTSSDVYERCIYNLLCIMFSAASSILTVFLVTSAADETLLQVQSVCGKNVILPCTADPDPTVQYYAVRWYEEGVSPRLSGLLSKELPNGRMRWYVGASSLTSVKDPYDLLLPNISCSQSGVYRCHLSAPVGERNREGRVRLSISDCPLVVEVEKTVFEMKFVTGLTAALVAAIALGTLALTCRLRHTHKKHFYLEEGALPEDLCQN